MFGFSEKKEETTSETSSANLWGEPISGAIADARKAGVGTKGRAKAHKSDGQDSDSRDGLSGKDAERLAKMFQPEKWKPIVRAPFNVMKAKTGRACWELDEKETETLAETTSATAEHFLQVDPKWMILTLFVFNWSLVIADKTAKNNKERLEEEKLSPPKPLMTPVMMRS